MPYFLKSGNTFRVSPKETMDLHERLPVGTYTIGFNQLSGQFFLEQIESFEIKGKLYGDTTRNADRIIQTFLKRPAATGVLLTGEKGSGKTLLAKCISIQAARDADVPTIVINKAWHGEEFNKFMQTIEQPVIVLLDEFEKVYCKPIEQASMLTLLDGVYPSKKLFLLTCNDKWKVNTNMRNRPGRIYYVLDFEGLDSAFIREYCQDNLKKKEHIPNVCAISGLFSAFNFDMLKAMVEEMNRYGETPSEVLKFLNVRPEFGDCARFRVKLYVNGKKLNTDKNQVQQEWNGNPIHTDIVLSYLESSPKKNGQDSSVIQEMPQPLAGRLASRRRLPAASGMVSKVAKFSPRDLRELDPYSGRYVFENEEHRLELVPVSRKSALFDYEGLSSRLTSIPGTALVDSDSDTTESQDTADHGATNASPALNGGGGKRPKLA